MSEVWIAAATLVVGAYSANQQKKSAQGAANAQARAAQDSNQLQWDMYNQSRQDAEPFRQNGITAQREYMMLMGLPTTSAEQAQAEQQRANALAAWDPGRAYLEANPDVGRSKWVNDPYGHYLRYGAGEGRKWQDAPPGLDRVQDRVPAAGGAPTPQQTQQAQEAAFARFRAQPGYQFRLQEGQRALDASASARGGLFSGAAGLEMQRYGQNYADAEGFTPYMNRLASLAGMAQTQNHNNAVMGANVTNVMGQNLQTAANARASGLQARADANSQLAAGVGNAFGSWYGQNSARNGGGTGWYLGNNPGRG